jgi:hypothetical protein
LTITEDIPIFCDTVAAGLGVLGVVICCAFAVRETSAINSNDTALVACSFFISLDFGKKIIGYKMYDMYESAPQDYTQTVTKYAGRSIVRVDR